MWGEHHRSVLLLRLCKEQYAYCQVICLWIPVHSPCAAWRQAWTIWGGWEFNTFPEDFWMALHDWAYCSVKFQPGDELSRGGAKIFVIHLWRSRRILGKLMRRAMWNLNGPQVWSKMESRVAICPVPMRGRIRRPCPSVGPVNRLMWYS